jgi:hypothetical protein
MHFRYPLAEVGRQISGTSEQAMDRHLAAKICRFCLADLRNSPLLRAIHAPKEVPLGCASNRHILIGNLFGPDLFSGSLKIILITQETQPL